MVCIYCSSATRVTNSRKQARSNNVWRRRQCTSCKAIFTTSEAVDWPTSVAVVKPNNLEPFRRDELFLSIHSSLKHRKQAQKDATALTATVLGKILPCIDKSVLKRDKIVEITTEVLKRFDKSAAVSYAAFHPIDQRQQ